MSTERIWTHTVKNPNRYEVIFYGDGDFVALPVDEPDVTVDDGNSGV